MNVITSIVWGTPSASYLFFSCFHELITSVVLVFPLWCIFHSIVCECARVDKTMHVWRCVRGYVFVSV